jgi:hypothetical protein
VTTGDLPVWDGLALARSSIFRNFVLAEAVRTAVRRDDFLKKGGAVALDEASSNHWKLRHSFIFIGYLLQEREALGRTPVVD